MAAKTRISAYKVIGAPFAAIPIYLLEHPDYWSVSAKARDLLTCLASQYNAGNANNGDLCAAESVMKKYRIWTNPTRKRVLKQLEDAELVVKTRQGHKRRCSLYALSWLPIDECPGKWLEIGPTKKPFKNYKGEWLEGRNKGQNIRS